MTTISYWQKRTITATTITFIVEELPLSFPDNHPSRWRSTEGARVNERWPKRLADDSYDSHKSVTKILVTTAFGWYHRLSPRWLDNTSGSCLGESASHNEARWQVMNYRRAELLNKRVDHELTAREQHELDRLQLEARSRFAAVLSQTETRFDAQPQPPATFEGILDRYVEE